MLLPFDCIRKIVGYNNFLLSQSGELIDLKPLIDFCENHWIKELFYETTVSALR